MISIFLLLESLHTRRRTIHNDRLGVVTRILGFHCYLGVGARSILSAASRKSRLPELHQEKMDINLSSDSPLPYLLTLKSQRVHSITIGSPCALLSSHWVQYALSYRWRWEASQYRPLDRSAHRGLPMYC